MWSVAGLKETPILINSFNRPHLVALLLEQLRKFGFCNVFFASDGPRTESENIEVKGAIQVYLDFCRQHDLKPRLLSRDENLGCRQAIKGAIDWFFESVDRGIILEDDCLPSLRFLNLVSRALIEERENEDIYSISGYDAVNLTGYSHPFRLSIFPMVWGWGTWSSRWMDYRLDFEDSMEVIRFPSDLLYQKHSDLFFRMQWSYLLSRAGNGRINTWDYSLTASSWRSRRFSLQVNGNSVRNLGFGHSATHTQGLAPQWARQSISADEWENSFEYERVLLKYDEQAIGVDKEIAKRVFGCSPMGNLKVRAYPYYRIFKEKLRIDGIR